MTKPDDDWQDLSRMWTEDGTEAGADAGLIASVRRRDVLARLNFAGEILVCLAALAFLGWALATHRMAGLPAAATFGFTVFAMAMTVWSRWRTPDCLTDTPSQALRTAAAQARSGRRWAWTGQAICAAAAVYLGGMALSLPRPSGDASLILAGGMVFILIWVVVYAGHIRATSRRLAACEQALAALETED